MKAAVPARLAALAALWLAVARAWPSAAAEGPSTAQADAPPHATAPAIRLPGYGPRVFGAWPTVDQMRDLGQRIFRDPGLSASGRMSCASCHDPGHGFGPPDARSALGSSLPAGGAAIRAVPTLRYLVTTIPFTEHYIDDEDGHGEDGGPSGALTWDGRVDTPHEQALIPLFAAHEFGNTTPAALAARVRRAPYAAAFDHAFSGPGEPVFDDPARVLGFLTMALEVYQQDAAQFYPYSSKYDAFLRGQTSLSKAEARGLALFNDPGKGNCASCHPSTLSSSGGLPRFTDSSYVALGVPRNPRLATNRDAAFHDLGLCANGRVGMAEQDDFCGRFKTPTLRNVARRQVFFHNGVFRSLREVVSFYAERDTRPGRWYPRDAQGRVRKFNDLPDRYHANVVATPPFGRKPGDRPALSKPEIDDIVTFLRTLDDEWRAPAAKPPARGAPTRLDSTSTHTRQAS